MAVVQEPSRLRRAAGKSGSSRDCEHSLGVLETTTMSVSSIADYALLSDCHSAALVSRCGSIDWLCTPRFDGPSLFGRLLDPIAGHWSLVPNGVAQIRRRSLPETMVLETTFEGSTGTLRVVDALLVGYGERGHDLGSASPGVLVRQITCLDGSVVRHTGVCSTSGVRARAPAARTGGRWLHGSRWRRRGGALRTHHPGDRPVDSTRFLAAAVSADCRVRASVQSQLATPASDLESGAHP